MLCFRDKPKLHSVDSKKLSPTEQNYDGENQELLPIKLALKKLQKRVFSYPFILFKPTKADIMSAHTKQKIQ